MSEISKAIAAKEAEVKTLQADIDALRRAASIVGQKRPATTKPKRRRKMSAAARKALSKRMKAYWANRRKSKK